MSSIRKTRQVTTLLLAVVVLSGGCGTGDNAPRQEPNQTRSELTATRTPTAEPTAAASFGELARRGSFTDYEPLDSPATARQEADVIFSGESVGMGPGVSYTFDAHYVDQPEATESFTYVTLKVEVTEALQGDAREGQVVPIQVWTSGYVSVEEWEGVAPTGPVFVMASDASDYLPRPEAQLSVPPEVRDFGEVFIALPDGLWWEDRGLTSMDRDAALLGETWGSPANVTDLVSAFD